jgi:hypothetical protein
VITMSPSLPTQEAMDTRLEAERPTLEAVWNTLRQTLALQGFGDAMSAIPRKLSRYELRRDAYDGSESLYGEWRTDEGKLLGTILVHATGQVFAEFDVLRPHPSDRRWFVEAVTAWGSRGAIKSELKLLPVLG